MTRTLNSCLSWRVRFNIWRINRRVDQLQRYVDDWKKEKSFAIRAIEHYERLKNQAINKKLAGRLK